MRKKHPDSLPLHELNPVDLEPTAENVELVRRSLPKYERVCLIWKAWEHQFGLPTAVPAPAAVPSSVHVVRLPGRGSREKITRQMPFRIMQGSVTDAVYQILTDAGRPITYQELEDELLKTIHADKIKEGDKPYYSPVQRLKEAGLCELHKGRIATPENLKRFLDEVNAGRAIDVETRRVRNKWSEAALTFLESLPNGATSPEIRDYLKSLPGFADETKHFGKTYIFNVVGKLQQQGLIVGTRDTAPRQRGDGRRGPKSMRWRVVRTSGNGAAHADDSATKKDTTQRAIAEILDRSMTH
jgi:hypothetical protein